MAASSCFLATTPRLLLGSSTPSTSRCGESIPPLHRLHRCGAPALSDDSPAAAAGAAGPWGRRRGVENSPLLSSSSSGNAFFCFHSSPSRRRAVAVFATQQKSQKPQQQQQQKQKQQKKKMTPTKMRDATVAFDDDDDDNSDGDGDGEAVEFADMEEWMAKKPSGFGLKEYDTSLEERLVAEMEAEEMAQAVKKKKPSPRESAKSSSKSADEIPEGVEVYVGNLPKKRNVDRDLRAAFRSVSGLLHIRPVLDGKQKSTREPVCKGLAFLTFASEDDALDFIERYNGENVKFGKAERGVACQLALPKSPFKKPGPGKQAPDAPRLGIIRDAYPDDSASDVPPSLASSSSSLPAEEFAEIQSKVRVDGNLRGETPDLDLDLDLDGTEEGDEDHGDDLDDLSDEDLEGIAQEIYVELEDEDDLELDRELEEEEESENDDSHHFPLNSEREVGVGFSSDRADGSENLVQAESQAPPLKRMSNFENSVPVEPKEDIRGAGKVEGLNLELADSSKSNAGAVDKDRRIQELESELEQLQLRLKEKTLGESPEKKVRELAVQLQEQRIQDLEKRIRSRANVALAKDPKIKVKSVAAPKKAASSKAQGNPKRNPSQTKTKGLGAASRLKKKERKIYTEMISKYSSSAS